MTAAGIPDGPVPGYLGRVLADDGGPVGTCFQVAPGVLVTACHVLDGLGAASENSRVRVDPLAGGDSFDVAVARMDPVHDLAVLIGEVQLSATAEALTATDQMALRDEVTVTGHAEPDDCGHRYRFLNAPGEWAGWTTRDDAVPLGRMTAEALLPGMSGAPVIRDRDGAIAGVVSGRYNSTDGWLAGTVWVARTEDLAVLLAGIAEVTMRRAPLAGLVSKYLEELIGQLNADHWPQDYRFKGPALEQARIERRLAISISGGVGENGDINADDLAGRCTRLVVLGGPGSGKTWLARRMARRCAEAALEALTSGASLDKVELPLFTTCSKLLAVEQHVREAAVSSAINQMPDLGGSRVTDGLKAFFSQRNAPTLLVIDGLDDTSDPDDRLGQLRSLPLPWKIFLTSRPSSWRQRGEQLNIVKKADPAHQVGMLQPLKYPGDVEPVITQWSAEDPAQGQALIAQIASRRDLQQGATVPLMLAFYCIIGADQRLPPTLHEVRDKVVWHLLSGLWRGPGEEDADPPACAAILRGWAWKGATRDDRTGIGTWDDEIRTPRTPMSQPDRAAVNHVAIPMSPPDLKGATLRRFIHRSIREHLTADHMPPRWTPARQRKNCCTTCGMTRTGNTRHPLRSRCTRTAIRFSRS